MGLDFELILHETRFESLFGFIFYFFHTENSDYPEMINSKRILL